jgi:hypothetical protein
MVLFYAFLLTINNERILNHSGQLFMNTCIYKNLYKKQYFYSYVGLKNECNKQCCFILISWHPSCQYLRCLKQSFFLIEIGFFKQRSQEYYITMCTQRHFKQCKFGIYQWFQFHFINLMHFDLRLSQGKRTFVFSLSQGAIFMLNLHIHWSM